MNSHDEFDLQLFANGSQESLDDGYINEPVIGSNIVISGNYYTNVSGAVAIGGAGDDSIHYEWLGDARTIERCSFVGGRGNDTIDIISWGIGNNTIDAGRDDDLISLQGEQRLSGNTIKYYAGDGNDTIYGFDVTNDKLQILGGGSIASSQETSNAYVITISNEYYTGTITFMNPSFSNLTNISYSDETRGSLIENSESDISLRGTDYEDTISNSGANVTILGSLERDSIFNSGSGALIYGGAGQDTIFNSADNVTIRGGEGSDYISVSSSKVTIVGSGDVVDKGGGIWIIGDDTIAGVDNDKSIVSIGAGLYKISSEVGNYFSIDGSLATQIENGSIATEYDDTIYAENLSTNIDALDGSDIISVMSGSGTIDGGSGADRIYLGSTTDITIVGSGDVSQTGSIWTIGEDSIYGVGSNYSITSAGDNLFKIVRIGGGGLSSLGLMVDTTDVTADDEEVVDLTQPTNVVIDDSGNIVVAGSNTESNAVISVDLENKSATLVMNESDQNYNLTFYNGGLVEKWNATLSGGNDQINIGNVTGGNFDGGEGKDIFNISKDLQGNISLTGGATNDNLESGNNFYAESSTVASSSSQSKITITDVNFNATDVVLIDAGVENLTADFFGDSRFYNYSSASDASTSGVYAGTVFDASGVVESIGMSHSMLRMADGSVTLDDENSIDENYITNVVWANSNSATVDFYNTQTDSVLIFTNTNSKGDIVSLGGDFDDTIHAGASDTIDAGGGDDLIYLNRRNHVVFGNSEGNDTIYGWDSTDTLDLSEIPDISISSNGLYLENNNGTLLIEGSFTNSTNIKYNGGIMRVGDSSGNVVYNKNVTYYAGSTLVINSSSNNTIDLSSSTYQNISNIDASNSTGRDTFRYTSDAGDVTISNGDSRDVVDLSNYSIDEISAEFTDSGLILTVNDSNLNIIGTNLTTFSLASGRYTADFQNQTLS